MGNESKERNQRTAALAVSLCTSCHCWGLSSLSPLELHFPVSEWWIQGQGSDFFILLKLGTFSCWGLVLLMLLLSSHKSQSVFRLQVPLAHVQVLEEDTQFQSCAVSHSLLSCFHWITDFMATNAICSHPMDSDGFWSMKTDSIAPLLS